MHKKITWKSPSNIALVKYWGKYGDQLPRNPSLSMTLRHSLTQTTIQYNQVPDQKEVTLQFLFEGSPNTSFEGRLLNYLKRIALKYPVLSELHLSISSQNTFPHSSGIASSASAFSALSLGLLSIIHQCTQQTVEPAAFLQEASELARLGSGSACRSVYGGFSVWGQTEGFSDYSNRYALPLTTPVHEVFQNFNDAILIVNAGTKKVGSSAGHQLMESNPYAQVRYMQAQQHVAELHQVLAEGNTDRFIEIVEQEALTLHALMMASQPGYVLMEGATLAIIDRIRAFRQQTGIPVCFTLDAGPNVHMLYPDSYKKEIVDLINGDLLLFCTSNRFLDDGMGLGPLKVTDQ